MLYAAIRQLGDSAERLNLAERDIHTFLVDLALAQSCPEKMTISQFSKLYESNYRAFVAIQFMLQRTEQFTRSARAKEAPSLRRSFSIV